MRGLGVLFLLGCLLAVGCLGLAQDDGSTGDEPVTRARAEVSQDEGAVAGTVTDTAVQPIEGANVTLVELNRTATTRGDGSFALSRVPPGSYTVTVRADGFLSAQQTTEVRAGETSRLDFLLTHVTSQQPFTQTFELKGFMEYGWGLGANLTGDAFWVRDNNCDYDPLAGPSCRGNFDMEPPLETIVFEMQWNPSTRLGDEMLAMMRVRDNASIITGEWSFFTVEGPSPLYHRMSKAELENVTDAFQERCRQGEDEFCGLNFWDRGWPMQTRVWPGWKCPTDRAGFCPVLQQDYTQVVTSFYHAPAPPGYSVFDGNP